MTEDLNAPISLRLETSFKAIYAYAAIIFTGVYFRMSMSDAQKNSVLLTNFIAERPYQYRVLHPLIAHLIHSVVPVDLVAINLLLTTVTVFLILFFFRRFLLLAGIAKGANWASLAILYPMAWNYGVINLNYYPSDLLGIAFFLAGITLILQRRWLPYYVLFFLAAINRETSCFIGVAFALLLWKEMPFTKMLAHLLAQIAIWAAIVAVITYIFRDNPGHIHDAFQLNLTSLGRLFTGHAPLYTLFFFMAFGGMHWVAIWGYKSLPDILKRLLWLVPLFFIPMIFVGEIFEIRIYNELVPLIAAAGMFTLTKRWKWGEL